MTITDELREFSRGWRDRRCHVELDTIADNIDAALDDYVALPKDADGETIHLGDVMEWPDGSTFEVVGIGDGTLYYVEGDGADHAEWTVASTKRHHHAPTVEDVLRDVVTLCHNTWKEGSAFEFYDVDDVMKSGNIADFAAKLRLAGDAE